MCRPLSCTGPTLGWYVAWPLGFELYVGRVLIHLQTPALQGTVPSMGEIQQMTQKEQLNKPSIENSAGSTEG